MNLVVLPLGRYPNDQVNSSLLRVKSNTYRYSNSFHGNILSLVNLCRLINGDNYRPNPQWWIHRNQNPYWPACTSSTSWFCQYSLRCNPSGTTISSAPPPKALCMRHMPTLLNALRSPQPSAQTCRTRDIHSVVCPGAASSGSVEAPPFRSR